MILRSFNIYIMINDLVIFEINEFFKTKILGY